MKLRTLGMLAAMLVASGLASAWEIELDDSGRRASARRAAERSLRCEPAGRAKLKCELLVNGKSVAETTTAADSAWMDLTAAAASRVKVSDRRRGPATVMTLNRRGVKESLVVRFATIASGDLAARGRQAKGRAGRSQGPTGLSGGQNSQHGGGNRGEGPPIPPGGIVGNDNPGKTVLTVNQLGRSGTAYGTVPMEHGSCGIDCATHELASSGGNLMMQMEVKVSCLPSQDVSFVSYQIQGHGQVTLVNGVTGSSSYIEQTPIVPHTEIGLETACRQELGGDWAIPNPHPNVAQNEQVLLTKNLKVWAKCTGDAGNTQKQITTKLQLTCVDQDFPG